MIAASLVSSCLFNQSRGSRLLCLFLNLEGAVAALFDETFRRCAQHGKSFRVPRLIPSLMLHISVLFWVPSALSASSGAA